MFEDQIKELPQALQESVEKRLTEFRSSQARILKIVNGAELHQVYMEQLDGGFLRIITWFKGIVFENRVTDEDVQVFLECGTSFDRLRIENERLRQECAELLKIVQAPIPVETTTCSYCAKCHEDFEPKQFVHYIVVDNNCVCIPCSPTISAEKEPRVYDPDHE